MINNPYYDRPMHLMRPRRSQITQHEITKREIARSQRCYENKLAVPRKITLKPAPWEK